ncbi:Thioredoxin-like domain-containing protein [Niabella drilacis]|uniref:Thioredoxin-like domain-containing protein n=2 Tax=Niabella drilacis (strain DSM 25811 / CCM 8410 / CCUG 62505 / LMG 26954 / E90) TaxID=1285928 RepID=A0A1G6S343_NIADE|nr:Thioredoxin-like domain-containing protein [Niabella drilacis]
MSAQAGAQLRVIQPETADSLIRQHPKPALFFVTADWCPYCRLMEQTTLKDQELISCLNQYFYFIRADADEKRPIRFLGRHFSYQPTGVGTGEHAFIRFLFGKRKTAYPALILLSPRGATLFQLNTVTGPGNLLRLLQPFQKPETAHDQGKHSSTGPP